MSIMKQVGKVVLLAGLLGMAVYANADPVNINKADAATLARSVSGIGPSKAKAIVVYRHQHGPFKTVQDLMKVKGIGKKFILKHKAELKLSDAKR